MKIKMSGLPDDLIKKCENCKSCIFEIILNKEQRKIKVLDIGIPKNHVHRGIVEQLCGKNYDYVCPMKYAAMRAFCDDRTAMQMGVVNIYLWDLGKKYKEQLIFDKILFDWGKNQNLGRDIEESYANRFKEVWNLGLREVIIDNELVQKQIFTVDFIYGIIMSQFYENLLFYLKLMIKEHKTRDSI